MDRKFFDRFDITLFLSVIGLIVIGIFAIYSATQSSVNNSGIYVKQLTFAIIGLVMVIGITYLPPRYISSLSYYAYGLALVLLLLVLVFGRTINGNKSWFYLAGFGIQPSEFAKVATVMAVSNFFYKGDEDNQKFSVTQLLTATGIVLLPAILIKLENDTGTTLVMLSFIIPMFFFAGVSPFLLFAVVTTVAAAVLAFINIYYFAVFLAFLILALYFFKKHWLLSAGVFVINVIAGYSVSFFYSKLQPYQQKRIMAVFDPASDPLGSGYNVIQSKVAIGSGGLFGKGFLQGSQTQLRFIPEQWTDFIYCMIGEEFGLLGAGVVILLFGIIIYRLLTNAYLSRNRYMMLACIGFASLFFFHMFINVGMTIGIAPVIGIPLPLVSNGVSSLMSFLLMVGIGMNTYRHKDIFLS
ncbi:MAG TPA: rod shape-determining protein RodA [Ignavibacteria bacterium]|nr:rod shape-determining protein RodA [Ignavibacteria bacterium]